MEEEGKAEEVGGGEWEEEDRLGGVDGRGEEGRGAMHAMSKKGLEGKEAGHGWKTECQFFFKPTHSSIVTPFRRHKNLNYYFLHFTILHCIESTH